MISRTYILILLFCVCNYLYSQTTGLDKKITLILEEVTLDEVLDKVSEIGNLNITYVYGIIPHDSIVSVNVKDKTINEILNLLLNDLNVEYEQIEKQLIIKPIKTNAVKEPEIEEIPKLYTISGYIKDSANNESLIGATIYAEEELAGTISNGYGFYSLTLPEGEYTIVYSFIGYKTISKTINLKDDIALSSTLVNDLSLLKEVVVYSVEAEENIEKSQMSRIKMIPEELKRIPGVFGENDFIQILNSIPGVKTFGGNSSFFYVRGGFRDQNLILIDEAPVYNTSHLLGLLSTFNTDAIKDIKIYTGDIPAKYGGRLSSVIDIKTKDGNMNNFSINGGYGLISSNISIQGPFKKEKSSYFLSLRKSHLRWIYKRISSDAKINFHDLHAKINFKTSRKNRFYFSIYSGNDFVGTDTKSRLQGLSWGNSTGTFRWNHLFSDRLFSNSTFLVSDYNYYIYTSSKEKNYWQSKISSASLKSDLTYYKSPEITYRTGIELSSYTFVPGQFETGNETTNSYLPQVSDRRATGNTIYFSREVKTSDKFSYRLGLRASVWNNVGPAEIYVYDNEIMDTVQLEKDEPLSPTYHLEPRISLTYRFNIKNSLNLSYLKTSQHIQIISNSISPFSSIEVWLPFGPNIKPQIGNQLAIGYRKKLPANTNFSVEIYARHMKNQIDYSYHTNTLLNPKIELDLKYGEARSYGVEFQFKKAYGKLNGWVAYTLSKTTKYIADLYGGKRFPTIYDRPHDISLYFIYELKPRLQLSGNWIYLSGSPFSSPTGYFVYDNYTLPVYTEKNNDRLPSYHRLDLMLTWKLNKKERRFNHHLSFAIYNFYNRKNLISINNNKIIDNEDIYIPANYYLTPELETTQMYINGVIPSINYSFYF